MESQFEVETDFTREKRVEYYRYVLRRRWLWLALYAPLGVLLTAYGIIERDLVWTAVGIFELAYGVWLGFRPRYLAAKLEKKEYNYSGDNSRLSVTTFGEEILDVGTDLTVRVPYDKVKEIHISKTMIYIKDVRDAAILMDKSGFRRGNYEDFVDFIREKCPQAKITK